MKCVGNVVCCQSDAFMRDSDKQGEKEEKKKVTHLALDFFFPLPSKFFHIFSSLGSAVPCVCSFIFIYRRGEASVPRMRGTGMKMENNE